MSKASVGNITADKIEFKLDDDLNKVDLAKVAAVILYHAERATLGRTANAPAIAFGPPRQRGQSRAR